MTKKENIYTVRELEPGIFRIGNSMVFMDLMVGAHHALLFDTGYGFGDLRALVQSITDKPLYVVNSHGHVDHACGNEQFGGAYIHPLDMALCREHNGPELRRPNWTWPKCRWISTWRPIFSWDREIWSR